MKWIVVIIIGAVIAVWLYKGRKKNVIEDPDVKTYEDKDFYLTSDENASEDESSRDNTNPRH